MPAVIEARRTGRPPRIAARMAGIAPMGLTAAIAHTARLPTIVDIPRHVRTVLRRVDTRRRVATAAAVAVITAAAKAEDLTVEAEASTVVEVADIVAEEAVTINPIS